jgi:hypothetical protein
MHRYFEIADRDDLSDDEKLDAYLAIAEECLDSDAYWAWCATHLPHLERAVLDWVGSDAFDKLLRDTVQATYPPHEWDRFMAHFGGLISLWVKDTTARFGAD